MRMLSSMLLGLSVSSAAADTVCDEDEQSLLQARAQARLDVANSKPDTALLLDSAKTFAQQMQHESPEAVNAFIASARSALSQMSPQLDEEHRSAQHQIDQQLADVHACGNSTSHGNAVTSDLAGRLDTMNQCMAEKAAAVEDQQQKCNDWQDHASRVAFPTSDLPSSPTADEVYQHTLRLQGWVQDQAATIVAQRNACDAATSHAVAETERCQPVIEEYDQIFCEHQISCLFLSSCHNHELERYENMRTDSVGAENARKAQYTMIEQVGCILVLITDAVNANATVSESSLSTCDGDTTDVEHLTLSFPDAGPALSCPGHQEGDPECPDVDVPTLWANGEAEGPQGPSITFEFCQGDRIGQQFTVTMPEGVHIDRHSTYGSPGLCYGPEQGLGDVRTDRLVFTRASHGLTVMQSSRRDCLGREADGAWIERTSGDGCNNEFTSRVRKNCGSYCHPIVNTIPERFIAAGGTGWENMDGNGRFRYVSDTLGLVGP